MTPRHLYIIYRSIAPQIHNYTACVYYFRRKLFVNIVCKPMSNNSQQQLELHWTGPEQTILDREVCSTTELPADRAQSLQYIQYITL